MQRMDMHSRNEYLKVLKESYFKAKTKQEKYNGQVKLGRFNNEVQHLGKRERRCYPKCLWKRDMST